MIRKYIEWRLGLRRVEFAVQTLRLEAERPGTDRQLRRYLNALADVVEGEK